MGKKVHIVYFFIVTLISISGLLAQENVRFDDIDLPDKIYNSWMHDFFQNSKGYIWFANSQGLNRYDGYELKTFRLPSDLWGATGSHYVVEDEHGFLWAGHYRVGVCRFNPALEKFEFLNYDTTDHNKRIFGMYTDVDGFIWIISDVGLYSFKSPAPGEKSENVSVLKYVHNPLDSTSLSTNAINTIFQDKQKRYWIGTKTNGIDILNERVPDGKFIHYPFSPDHNSVSGNNIRDIFQDSYGNIWISTQNSGISIVVNDTLSDNIYFTNYTHDDDDQYSLVSNRIFKIVQTKVGTVWISAAYGLQKVESEDIDFNNLKFDTYTSNLNSPGFLYVNDMYPDREGRLWISKYGTGISVYDPARYKFHHYKISDSRIGHNVIRSFFEMPGSKGRKIWIATSAGLYLFNRDNNEFNYADNQPFKNELKDNIIRFYQSRFNKNIWIGSKRFDLLADTIALSASFCGFKKFDPYTGLTTALNKNAKTLLTHKNDSTFEYYPVKEVYDIEEISKKYIVLATNFGIALYDQEEDKYILKPKDPLSKLAAINGEIIDLLYDSRENLWISVMSARGDHGVFRFNPRTGKLRNYLNYISEQRKSVIQKIIEDSKGDIWFAGVFGLLKYINEIDSIIFYDLPKIKYKTLGIKNILKDDNNNLWLSGQYLTKFNIENESYWTYKEEDGLQGDNFQQWAAYKSPVTGEMYFGGENGFNIFHPDSIKVSTYVPPIYITNFELMNKPATLADYMESEHILPGESIKSIILNYDQNSFSFRFAALDYTNPSNNRYLYKLDGLDKDWIQSYDRKATYTNLDPGGYIFRIKGSNHDGIWNKKETLLKITILPPWWKTNLAYFIYTILISGLFYSLWRYESNLQKLKYNLKLEHVEAEKLKEIDQIKSRFFTNISHEFRTPLTLILGPVKQIIERTKEERTRNDLKVVHKNANNLIGFVNQLLDISKIESGNMKLQVSSQDIISLLKDLMQPFCSYAERKRINLKFKFKYEEIIAYIDKEKIEKIITNLLSNAFKFTPEEGEIEVSINSTPKFSTMGVSRSKIHKSIIFNDTLSPPLEGRGVGQNGFVEISIRDNGIGIPKENIPKIFDRFYQVNGNHTRKQQGTGIGLSLTKELVELHKGKIEVESEEGKGTTFIVSIPLGKEHLAPGEICNNGKVEVSYNPTESIIIDEDKKEKPGFEEVIPNEKPILLIVEDNYDVRNYIIDNLKDDYKILEAKDGEEGWNKSIENMPDLIISDVMMPKMDGFELCNKLKTDERTSHIPVILLTARAAKQDKIEGFETGADEYIMKPFETDELNARIINLIEQRKRIHEHFRKNGLFEIEKKQVTPVDHKFIQKAVNVINENIADPDFNVEKFAEKLAIGRSLLNKKFTGLIGEPPVEFIRRIRLTRAAELIEKKFGNISEIALEVGFNNPAYFSDCFKRQFGVVPSQYKGYKA